MNTANGRTWVCKSDGNQMKNASFLFFLIRIFNLILTFS
ncbi:Uncharacterized protein dnm_063960 [Desulfonema magnum]|uniref:Uncharacterized protein n=1 Tax=Desulfonema magnum TaxID=45655 RepID=A0A975BRN6_9BACT|nr:Uncharacterized protein dnm_063960 [Desulfonema magnum]